MLHLFTKGRIDLKLLLEILLNICINIINESDFLFLKSYSLLIIDGG